MERKGFLAFPFKSPVSSPSSPSPYSPFGGNTFSVSMMEETIENAEPMITKWDSNSSSYAQVTYLFLHSRKEAKEYLKHVKDLRRAMHLLVSEFSTSDKLVLGQNLMIKAMSRLEIEFHQILSSNRDRLNPESVSSRSSADSDDDIRSYDDDDEAELKKVGDSITEVEKASAVAMLDLKAIADCMVSCGYGIECIKVYKAIRKSIVDEGLRLLGIETYRTSRTYNMNWDVLEHKIKNWVIAVKIAVNTLFRGEKVLCDYVFSGSDKTRESCFYEITKEGATNLFRFPELVAKSKRSVEKTFCLMDLHEAMSEHWQDMESIFSFRLASPIMSQALSSRCKLSESIHFNLLDFESAVQKNSSKTCVPGGGIHPLTRSAMSFISSLAGHSGVLYQILVDYPPERQSPLPESYFDGSISGENPTATVSVHLAWLILVLLCKLDTKAELYKNVSLSYLFLANNLHFVVKEVNTSELRIILGDEWAVKQIQKIKLYASTYETVAWAKVFCTLPEKTSTLSPEDAKERFRRFHARFEEAYMKQTSWVIPDGKLRDELKVSIAKKLVPEYTQFYQKYLEMLSGEKNLEALVRFGPDNLENYLSDLFHGTPILSGYSSSSSSSCSSRGCIPKSMANLD